MTKYLHFEETMRALKISQEKLMQLVCEGKLRAFRVKNRMKFREEDVKKFKKNRKNQNPAC